MGYLTTATISGLSRSDGVTARTVTMTRVAQIPNGFIMRETIATAPNQVFAQEIKHTAYEMKSKTGNVVRHQATEIRWPFETSVGSGILGGEASLTKTGLHIPANCPTNVRKDIVQQLSYMASGSAGTLGYELVVAPVINGLYPF